MDAASSAAVSPSGRSAMGSSASGACGAAAVGDGAARAWVRVRGGREHVTSVDGAPDRSPGPGQASMATRAVRRDATSIESVGGGMASAIQGDAAAVDRGAGSARFSAAVWTPQARSAQVALSVAGPVPALADGGRGGGASPPGTAAAPAGAVATTSAATR